MAGFQPPLLQMPAEVLDLISDFLMELDPSVPRPYDPNLDKNCRSLQSLRHTCRKMVPPSTLVPYTNVCSTTTLSPASISSPSSTPNVVVTAPSTTSSTNQPPTPPSPPS